MCSLVMVKARSDSNSQITGHSGFWFVCSDFSQPHTFMKRSASLNNESQEKKKEIKIAKC